MFFLKLKLFIPLPAASPFLRETFLNKGFRIVKIQRILLGKVYNFALKNPLLFLLLLWF